MKQRYAIRTWPFPTSLEELRRFLGFAGFYRRFIKDFSTIACPLHELTKKNVPFIWGNAHDFAFNELKRLLTEAPLLALPDFSKTFEIEYLGEVQTEAQTRMMKSMVEFPVIMAMSHKRSLLVFDTFFMMA